MYVAGRNYNYARNVMGQICPLGPKELTKKEDSLVSYLEYMSQRGFPLTQTLTKAFAWAIAVRRRKDNCFGKEDPSEHWWVGFRQTPTAISSESG